ncbi:hypothetical protein [Janthinobacterium sp. RB2R34]|uniref:hypothetical protein n=1 Tax=Janthinobacterium sp. RB2R34 TaxID=3424193 RepID=UPI003F2692DE
MRPTTFAFTLATAFAAGFVHAATIPTLQQIQAAVDAGVAKTQSSMPIAVKVTSLSGCLPSPEVKDETVCLVSMSAGMRDGYMVLPLRQKGGNWVGVERKNAQFPGPAPAEAMALVRAWASDEMARDPEAAKDKQLQEAATSMQVKSLDNCEIKRKTGYLACDSVLSVPNRDDIKTELTFMLESTGWRYVPR